MSLANQNIVYNIRFLQKNESALLEKLLYEAIYQPDNIVSKLPYEVIYKPELFHYISEWGRNGDSCLVVEFSNKIVGAVWSRLFSELDKGYGFIDSSIPELTIAIEQEYRNQKLGTMLMTKLLDYLKQSGFRAVSLSVSKENFATKLYKKLGFRIYQERDDDFVMIIDLC